MPYIEGSIAGHKRYHTSKDPKYRTLFCPKSLDQNKNQVHPIFCEGVSLHRRWNCLWRHKVIYQFFHPCSQFLIIVHGGSFLFGGDKNLKITALSFISTGPDRCACKEPLAPSTWTKCSSRHLSSLSIMWKVKQDPFFLQTLEDFIISILPPIIGDLDSTRVVVEVFSKSTFITWQSCEVWHFCNEKVPTTLKFS